MNVGLLELIKKFNMDILVKMDRFQIKQNVECEIYSRTRQATIDISVRKLNYYSI